MTHPVMPQLCAPLQLRSGVSGGDSLPLREAACSESHVPSSHGDVFNDLLTVYLLHLAYNSVILSLDEVVASFVVPEVSVLSE